MDRTLIKTTWCFPTPDATDRAFEHHAAGFVRWLLRAGAEPRLALVLCAGAGTDSRLIRRLTAEGVEVVRCTATAREPIPAPLAAHVGDHFNRRLFWLEGLDEDEAVADGWSAAALSRSATWVAVVVRTPKALEALASRAPALLEASARRVLVVQGPVPREAHPPVSPALLAEWREAGRAAELAFHFLLCPDSPPKVSDFDRLVRTGYVAALQGAPFADPLRTRWVSLWANARGIEAARALGLFGPGEIDAESAHLLAERIPETASAVASVLSPDVQRLLSPQGDALAVLEMGAERPLDADAIARLLAETQETPLAFHARMAVAAAYAAAGELDRCQDALAQALACAAAPEAEFMALEKRARLLAYTGERQAAAADLERLFSLALHLASPLYEGLAHLTRAELLATLDPFAAREAAKKAHRLLSWHGYPALAVEAQALMEPECGA